MTVYRADPSETETIDIELTKKAGKNLGLGFFTSNPRGILVTDIVSHLTLFLPQIFISLSFRFLEASPTLMDASKKVIL
jgi:hypothetical protein